MVRDQGEDVRSKKWVDGRPMSQSLKRGPAFQVLKERRYIFDRTFDSLSDTQTVYKEAVQARLAKKLLLTLITWDFL